MSKVKTKLSLLSPISSFLILEVLAVISFNLTNNFIIYSIIALFGALFLVLTNLENFKKSNFITFFIFLILIIAFSLFIIFSYFNLDPNYNPSVSLRVFIFIGLFSISIAGYFSAINKSFKIDTALKVIYIALGLYVLTNLFITFIQFKFGYTFSYRKKYFYYNGAVSRLSVGNSAYMLLGFSEAVVNVAYFDLFATILSTALIGTLFVNRKDDLQTFLIYLICGLVGIISILFTINIMSIITTLLISIVLLILILVRKEKISNKPIKIILFVLLGCFVIGLILVICNSLKDVSFFSPLRSFILDNRFLNKLFNTNRFIKVINDILYETFDNSHIYGFSGYLIGKDKLTYSNSWFFDIFQYSSLFGAIALFALLFAGFKQLNVYVKNSSDSLVSKVLIESFILSFLVYSLFNYQPLIDAYDSTVFPIYLTTPFIIMIFLISYTFKTGRTNDNE